MAFFAKTFFFINEQLQKIKFEIKIFENICWGPQNGQNGFGLDTGETNLFKYLFIFSF